MANLITRVKTRADMTRQSCAQFVMAAYTIFDSACQNYYVGKQVEQLTQQHLSEEEVQKQLDELTRQYNLLRFQADSGQPSSNNNLASLELKIRARLMYLGTPASGL